MRWMLVGVAAFFGGTFPLTGIAVLAQEPAPPPSLPPLPSQVTTAPDAPTYPRNFLQTIEMIEEGYVRPVARVDLLVAALSGLYEVTGESVPATLRAEAERAIVAKEVQRLIERVRKRPEIARRLKDEEALLASCRAMLRVLDPHCEILIGDEARRTSGRMDNFGVGIDLEEYGDKEAVRIKEVLPGSPAQKAGLLPGDRITAIDGQVLRNADAFQVTLALNGRESTTPDLDIAIVTASHDPSTVRVTMKRENGAKSGEIRMERRQFHVETVFGLERREDNSWDYWIDRERKIAHVRLGALRDGTADELRQVLSKLSEAGLRGLLLDLRWCPGGLVDQSVESAKLFLNEGEICKVRAQSATVKEYAPNSSGRAKVSSSYRTGERGPFHALPILVLVNGDTSGGGELITAVLQDQARAVVAGQRTRGKASIQTMSALPARGAFLKLTTGVFIRPNGKNLNRFPDSKPGDDWGVRPDDGLEFRVSAALDRQLKEWWTAQTLRPGGSRERLPLDDPNNDPQRQWALQVLRERMK